MRVSRSTGVMMNNALADFSELEAATRVVGGGGAATAAVGAAQANSMAPFKRPLTSLCPTLVLGKGTLLAIGGAGGLRVPTSLAQVGRARIPRVVVEVAEGKKKKTNTKLHAVEAHHPSVYRRGASLWHELPGKMKS